MIYPELPLRDKFKSEQVNILQYDYVLAILRVIGRGRSGLTRRSFSRRPESAARIACPTVTSVDSLPMPVPIPLRTMN